MDSIRTKVSDDVNFPVLNTKRLVVTRARASESAVLNAANHAEMAAIPAVVLQPGGAPTVSPRTAQLGDCARMGEQMRSSRPATNRMGGIVGILPAASP